MNAPLSTIRIDPVECFNLRCWARAYMFAAGMLDLHEAVDVLAADAALYGLDADAAQKILAAAFREVR